MNPRINESAEKDIRAYFGSSGSGKTYNIKNDIKHEKRVLAFDPEGSFSVADGFKSTTNKAEFLELARNSNEIRLCFAAGGTANFSWFCDVIFALADARRPHVVVVDELGGVTTPSKANGSWFDILSGIRKYNGKVRAGAQSAAEIDKTLMRNKNGMYIGYQERAADSEYLSRETGIPVEDITALRGAPHYDHIWYKGRGRWKLVKGK